MPGSNTGSPLRQSQDVSYQNFNQFISFFFSFQQRKSAMDRSQVIADRSAHMMASDAAAAYRYRSKSPIHGGPHFEELRQQ